MRLTWFSTGSQNRQTTSTCCRENWKTMDMPLTSANTPSWHTHSQMLTLCRSTSPKRQHDKLTACSIVWGMWAACTILSSWLSSSCSSRTRDSTKPASFWACSASSQAQANSRHKAKRSKSRKRRRHWKKAKLSTFREWTFSSIAYASEPNQGLTIAWSWTRRLCKLKERWTWENLFSVSVSILLQFWAC